MTRWLLNRTIPNKVLAPSTDSQPSRECEVVGLFTLPECPNCKREGPVDCMALGPGNMWPNSVVVCGDNDCGLYWSLVSQFPPDTKWRSDVTP